MYRMCLSRLDNRLDKLVLVSTHIYIYTFLIFRSTTQYYFDVVVFVAILQYDIFVSFRFVYIYMYINISYISLKKFSSLNHQLMFVWIDDLYREREK